MSAMRADDFPEFRPRRFWAQRDLQTLRREIQTWLFGLPELPAHEPLAFPMADGTSDVLFGSYHRPPEPADSKPLVIVIHGLPGSEASAVVVHSAASLLHSGFPVLRLNLRGAGPSLGRTRGLYHAGRSQDLHQVIARLPQEIARNGIVLVAFSLGANMMLKALGESELDARVRAAVAVSAPLDLAEVAHHLLNLGAIRRFIYVGSLLRGVKRQACQVIGLTEAQRQAIRSASSLYEFDEKFLAPFSGFSDAAAYYRESSSELGLAHIRVPTLLIHAPNDPIIPIDVHRRFDWAVNPLLSPLLSAAGGHAGFQGRGSRIAWHDRCIGVFLERLGAI